LYRANILITTSNGPPVTWAITTVQYYHRYDLDKCVVAMDTATK